MPNLRFALAAGIIAVMPLSVRADSITEVFTLTVPPTTLANDNRFQGTTFALFNPADGTLNDFMTTLTGPAAWFSSSLFPNLFATLQLPDGDQVVSGQSFTSLGPITVNILGTDSFGPDLTSLTGTGTRMLDF